MSLEIILTEEEILKTPNYQELGELVYSKLWDARNILKETKDSSDYVHITVGVNGDADSIGSVEEYDKCVICGKQSPYPRSTNIDMRTGYIEGSGQGCFHLLGCKDVE